MNLLKIIMVFMLSLLVTSFFKTSVKSETSRDDSTNPKEQGIQLEQIVVTGTKTEEKQSNVADIVTVITKEEIKELSPGSTLELLESASSLNFDSMGGWNYPVIQGVGEGYVKILIDGVPIKGKIRRGVPLHLVPVSEVERIEILKGPGSTLYGSDAIGGVINIITKKKGKRSLLDLNIDQRYDTMGKSIGEVLLNHRNDYFGIDIIAGYTLYDGKQETIELATSKRDVYLMPKNDTKNARATLSLYIFEKTDVDITGGYFEKKRTASPADATRRKSNDIKSDGTVKLTHNISDDLSFDLYSSYENFRTKGRDYDLDWGTSGPLKRTTFDTLESEMKTSWKFDNNNNLLLGYNLLWEKLKSYSIEGIKERYTHALFLQDIYNLQDKIIIIPGIRDTYNEEFGNDISPKLSLRYNFSDELSTRATYGQGYKSPSFKNQYYSFFHPFPANFWLRGNPELKPEKSNSVNLSLFWKPAQAFNIEGTYFYNRIQDMIVTVKASEDGGVAPDGTPYNGLREYENKDKAYTTGGEFEVKGKASELLLYSAGYVYLKAKYKEADEKSYKDMEYRSTHSIKGNVTFILPLLKSRLNLNAVWNSKQVEDSSTGEKTPDYLMINLGIRQPLVSHFEIYGGIKNLLNNTKEHWGLYEGRYFFIGLKAHFNDVVNIFLNKGGDE